MCRRVTCPQCGKPTFSGCGAHVEQVLGDVPKGERCQGHETTRPTASGKGSWLSNLFGAGEAKK
ncbi:MAG: hypothetical protein ABI565_10580 [Vicinamibacteria bacterium]